jgi:cell division protein FtsN
MTDYDRDRGAYTPSGESPLAFDPRSQGGRAHRPGGPPTTLIISALILLVLLGGIFIYYRSGVRRSGEPPVVGQTLGDIKQPAPASSQPTDEAAGLSIYKAEEAPAASSAPRFTPPPEEPHPLAAPAARTPAPSLKGPAAPSAPTPQNPAPAASPEAAARAIMAVPAPAPAATKPASTPAASGAGRLVQIGAYSSTALADKGWNDIAKLLPGEMVGRTKSVEPVAKDGQTLYRAYIGGFGSKAEAQAFCGELKGQGHTCFVK